MNDSYSLPLELHYTFWDDSILKWTLLQWRERNKIYFLRQKRTLLTEQKCTTMTLHIRSSRMDQNWKSFDKVYSFMSCVSAKGIYCMCETAFFRLFLFSWFAGTQLLLIKQCSVIRISKKQLWERLCSFYCATWRWSLSKQTFSSSKPSRVNSKNFQQCKYAVCG
jgi:hypothetical protein